MPAEPRPITPPFYPIIYVRGYAATMGQIEETVGTPYMGFNLGSTKVRQRHANDQPVRFIFESPLIRLMKDETYICAYRDGDFVNVGERVDSRSVWIFRYYEKDSESFGDGEKDPIESYAEDLGHVLLRRNELQGLRRVLRHVEARHRPHRRRARDDEERGGRRRAARVRPPEPQRAVRDRQLRGALFEVDQKFWFDEHFEGETLLNETVTLHLRRSGGKATVRYGLQTHGGSGNATKPVALSDPDERGARRLEIPLGFKKGLKNPPRPGFRGRLLLTASPWNM